MNTGEPRRRLYLDEGPGETRGVVSLGGAPERLLIERAADRPEHSPGARLAARVRRIEGSLSTAFLDVGTDPDAVLPLTGEASRLTEGARLEVEVVSAPRRDKGAVVRLIGDLNAAERVSGLLAAAPSLAQRLQRFAPGAAPTRGQPARDAADLAETQILAEGHPLPSGGAVFIEPTRALVAVDVDMGRATGDARRTVARTNREAVAACARLLRLKGLGGPVVIDLAGKGHDGDALKQAATLAFAPDQPGVAFGAVTRFGLWPLVLPRRAAPLAEILGAADGVLSDETLAFRLLREIERAAGPGLRIEARAAPQIAAVADRFAGHLVQRIGPRFHISADPAASRTAPQIAPIVES